MDAKARLHAWSQRGLEIRHLPILENGSCERFKAGVHGLTLGLAAVMAAYNAAAWVRRREDHLAVNAVIYALAVVWERLHVVHHLRSLPVAAAVVEVSVSSAASVAEAVEPLPAAVTEAA